MTLEKATDIYYYKPYLRKTIIILISGKAGVGKTTFAVALKNYLVDNTSYEARIFSFAYRLKEIARTHLNWDGDKDEKGRKLLQNLGNIARTYDKNIWVHKVMNDIEDDFFPVDFGIIDDWRFDNELKEFVDCGRYAVYTINMQSTLRGGLEGSAGEDESENGITTDTFDFLICNDKEKVDLNELAKLTIKTILEV